MVAVMFDLANYSETVHRLLYEAEEGRRLMPLAPSGPLRHPSLDELRGLKSEALFDGEPVVDPQFADCVKSGLLLYFSALDDSHTLSQSIDTTSGSFLHGIMHRQEPDASNAKYWFRRVGRHELFPTLAAEAGRLSLRDEGLTKALRERTEWDAGWFVDLCEQARRDPNLEPDVLLIQRLEWDLLIDYCYRRALAG